MVRPPLALETPIRPCFLPLVSLSSYSFAFSSHVLFRFHLSPILFRLPPVSYPGVSREEHPQSCTVDVPDPARLAQSLVYPSRSDSSPQIGNSSIQVYLAHMILPGNPPPSPSPNRGRVVV